MSKARKNKTVDRKELPQMSDIFEEKEDLKNVKSLVIEIRKICSEAMKPAEQQRIHNMDRGTYLRSLVDPDEAMRRKALALRWPGNDLVQQIVIDALKIMREHGIKPQEVLK
jgi:hypothetical protein